MFVLLWERYQKYAEKTAEIRLYFAIDFYIP
jgi:hypothetical protein